MANEENDLGSLYVEVLKRLEQPGDPNNVAAQTESIGIAVSNALLLIERLSLCGAAHDACMTMLLRRLHSLKQSNDEFSQKVADLFGDIVAVKEQVLATAFSSELEFMRTYEKMVRARIMKQAGIDPNDEKAVYAHLAKLASLQQKPNANN